MGNSSCVGSFGLTNTNTVGEGTAKLGDASADYGSSNTNKWLNTSADTGVTGGALSISVWVNITTAPSNKTYVLVGQASSTNLIAFELAYMARARVVLPDCLGPSIATTGKVLRYLLIVCRYFLRSRIFITLNYRI